MKRKLCLLFILPLLFAACEKEIPDKTYTEYDGVVLPERQLSRDIMNDMLNLIEQQDGRFSDKDLLDALSTKQIRSSALYFVYDVGEESETWLNANERPGYVPKGNMLADDGGVLLASHKLDVTYNYWFEGHIAHYLAQQGYDGWYSTHRWSYNADTNVFATVVNGKEKVYEAEVMYFDENTLILKGKIGGMDVGVEQYDNLYLFELTDKHDSFFERRTSGEEYYNIWDTYCKANGVENEFNILFFTNTH